MNQVQIHCPKTVHERENREKINQSFRDAFGENPIPNTYTNIHTHTHTPIEKSTK